MKHIIITAIFLLSLAALFAQNKTELFKPSDQYSIQERNSELYSLTPDPPTKGIRNTKSINTFYGFVGLGGTTNLYQGLASITRNTPGDITSIVTADDPGSVFGGTLFNDAYWGINALDNSLLEINLQDGSRTTIATPDILAGHVPTSVAYDPISEGFYISSWDYASNSCLYLFNTDDNSTTLIDTIGETIIFSIAFDGSGNLYGLDVNAERIGKIDPATASWDTLQNTLGFNANYIQDLEWDYYSSKMYYAAYNATVGSGQLYTVNLTTGTPNYIGDFLDNADITGLVIPVPEESNIECMPGASYSQAPVDFENANTSNIHAGHRTAQLVENLQDPISGIRFFGVQGVVDGSWVAVNDIEELEFIISFYPDNGGVPDDVTLYQETVSLNHTTTEDTLINIFEVFYWDYIPSIPISWLPENYWVTIENTDETAWFLWLDKPYGLGSGAQNSGSAWVNIYPRGICIKSPEPVNVEEIIENIRIYPNPSDGMIKIETADAAYAEVYDLTGKLITEKRLKKGTNTIRINNKGVYFVKIDDACKKVIIY